MGSENTSSLDVGSIAGRSYKKSKLGSSSKKTERSYDKDTYEKPKPLVLDIESEDISLSQLELMANKKKMNKPKDPLLDLISKEKEETPSSKVKISKKKSSSSSSSSTLSSSSDDTKKKRKKEKAIKKENENEMIRKEKCEFLFKFNKLNVKGKWSSLKLTMNNSLEEIRNECERVKNEISTERSVGFFKRMLLLGVQGIEMVNNKFDPLGVDLDGWSEAMGYSMENQEYDEVMAELYEKYKGAGQMSPEMKLIFMIISSATMFTISKKITKLDSNNALKSLIGGLMGSSTPQQAPQQPQTQYQQQIPNVTELRNRKIQIDASSEEDNVPSKINGPQDDNIDINNILKTMNQRRQEKQETTEESDDVLKSIQMGKKKRGRPPAIKKNK